MLREAESIIKKEKPVFYVGETNKKRKANKTLKKGKSKRKPGKTKVAKKDPAKDKGQCFRRGKNKHWKGNYKNYFIAKVLAKPRSLARGEMDLKMGNGTRVTAVVVGEGTTEASATESLHRCRGSSDGEGAQ
ncbi:hypothetical protein B296_00002994 [Ensete ventricosum]|uniref:Uncharacterized protein n=1 Tax=Ensete ventricosum TaxID=4639 RepID=A0A426Z5H6_ENSVE|nr:hypothetical protein B296_00002994 [Ensete ventricosum]